MSWRLAVCLFCVVFPLSSLSAQNVRQPTEQSVGSAEAVVVRAGGIVSHDGQDRVIGLQFPENLTLPDHAWTALEKLTDLRELDLSAMLVTNDRLQHVGKLTNLRSLNLFGNPIDSVAIENLVGLQKLETLYLYRTFVDDEAVLSLSKLSRLKRLNMFDTFLTDKGLTYLESCSSLRHLTIGNTNPGKMSKGKFPESFFSEAGIEGLRKKMADTEILVWSRTDSPEVPVEVLNSRQVTGVNSFVSAVDTVDTAPNLAERQRGDDWAGFLGLGEGKSAETGLNLNWRSSPPKLLWHKRVGTGYSAPAIAKGRVLVFHRIDAPNEAGRFVERLSCWHSETGESLWKVDTPTQYEDINGYGNGPRSTPVVDSDRVYTVSPSGTLECRQLLDGKLLWKIDLQQKFGRPPDTYGYGTTPIVFKEQLILIVGGTESDACGVVGFDKHSGKVLYGVGNDLASYASPRVAKIEGRWWCFAFTREGLIAFNPENGRLDFKFPWKSRIAGSVNAASPVVVENEILISEAYRNGSAMLKLAGNQPQILWQDSPRQREKSLAMHWATPIYHEGFVYGCSGRHSVDGVLKCIDWKTGQTRWEQKVADRGSMVFVDGCFINLGENGLVTLFKATPDGYVELGRIAGDQSGVLPSYPAWTAPVVSHGRLYLRGKHEVICYDLAKSKEADP
jgi:outer membrane protein assembly factor BamB